MALKQRIDDDLKAALLAGDKQLVTILRTLKSAILYAEVEKGARDRGLNDDEISSLLQKESKKRRESAQLYEKGGRPDKVAAEMKEVEIIDEYLPSQLSDEELFEVVDRVIAEQQEASPRIMGQAIARVKELSGNRADGSRIAAMVKERLNKQ